MYEGGIRVPFIVNWPGTVPAGTTNNEVIAFWDMMPTFAELAGVKPPDNIDGYFHCRRAAGKKTNGSTRVSLLGLRPLSPPLRSGRASGEVERYPARPRRRDPIV